MASSSAAVVKQNAVVDIFPVKKSEIVPKLKLPKKKREFRKYTDIQQPLEYYVSFYEHEQMKWLKRRTVGNAQLNDHLLYVLQRAMNTNDFKPEKIKWDHIENRTRESPKKRLENTDCRTVFKMNANIFATKEKFTFGQRRVADGTVHLYQTSAAPILFYVLSDKKIKSASRPLVGTGVFKGHDQFLYDQYVLRPYSRYAVNPHLNYLIVTVQKTIFRVDIVTYQTCLDLHGKGMVFQDPTKNRSMAIDPLAPASSFGESNIRKAKRQRDDRAVVPVTPPKRRKTESVSSAASSTSSGKQGSQKSILEMNSDDSGDEGGRSHWSPSTAEFLQNRSSQLEEKLEKQTSESEEMSLFEHCFEEPNESESIIPQPVTVQKPWIECVPQESEDPSQCVSQMVVLQPFQSPLTHHVVIFEEQQQQQPQEPCVTDPPIVVQEQGVTPIVPQEHCVTPIVPQEHCPIANGFPKDLLAQAIECILPNTPEVSASFNEILYELYETKPMRYKEPVEMFIEDPVKVAQMIAQYESPPQNEPLDLSLRKEESPYFLNFDDLTEEMIPPTFFLKT